MSYLIDWLLDLWAAIWRADERVNGPSGRRWPWVVFWIGVAVLAVVWGLEGRGTFRR